jgi:hypothetical protein
MDVASRTAWCGVCPQWCWVPGKPNIASGTASVKLQCPVHIGQYGWAVECCFLLLYVSSNNVYSFCSERWMYLSSQPSQSSNLGRKLAQSASQHPSVCQPFLHLITLLGCYWSAGRVVGAWLVYGYLAVWGPVKGPFWSGAWRDWELPWGEAAAGCEVTEEGEALCDIQVFPQTEILVSDPHWMGFHCLAAGSLLFTDH